MLPPWFFLLVFSTNNFINKEFSGIQEKNTMQSRKRVKTSFNKFFKRDAKVSPKKSAIRPSRADSSDDFLSPKRKKYSNQPGKDQRTMKDFFSKASTSSEVEATTKTMGYEEESDLNIYTDQLTMAHIGKNLRASAQMSLSLKGPGKCYCVRVSYMKLLVATRWGC